MIWKYQLSELNWGQEEREAVAAVMQSAWITAGDETKSFEEEFVAEMRWVDREATAVSSCTAAIHLALLDIGIVPGDEVIVPALTFVSCWNVVKQLGATPVFADCDRATGNVLIENLRHLITSRTKAVIIVHFAGEPVIGTPAIAKYLSDMGVPLVEDVAHAPGASIHGHCVGGFGDYGCFSFFSNKNIAVGEGGMVVASPERTARLATLRSHGMTASTITRFQGRAFSYDVKTPGLNYRTDEMRSAIGRVQLAKMQVSNQKRVQLLRRYKHRLSGLNVRVLGDSDLDGITSVAHIAACLLPDEVSRVALNSRLKEMGIQSSYHYPAPWSFSAYAGAVSGSSLPGVAAITESELTLPLHPKLQVEDVDEICDAVGRAFNELC